MPKVGPSARWPPPETLEKPAPQPEDRAAQGLRLPTGQPGGPPASQKTAWEPKTKATNPPEHPPSAKASIKHRNNIPEKKQALQPKDPQARGKQRAAIAEAWKVKMRYNIQFESCMLLVMGQQSAGKTAFVERFLGYAFSVVKRGIGTMRPAILTCLPQELLEFLIGLCF